MCELIYNINWEFLGEYDCPKCGKELDEEYKLCECGYWKFDGAGDILADRRADK